MMRIGKAVTIALIFMLKGNLHREHIIPKSLNIKPECPTCDKIQTIHNCHECADTLSKGDLGNIAPIPGRKRHGMIIRILLKNII